MELISTLNSDPWGLPYKLVIGKLRKSSPALTETLERNTLSVLLNSLFPMGTADRLRPEVSILADEEEDMEVGIADVIRFVVKRPSRDAAPGPDNFKASVWKRVPRIVLAHLAGLFTNCLRTGIFLNLGREQCSY